MLLRLAVAFFVLTLIAALFGFFGLAAATASIAKTLFFVFLIVFLLTFVLGLMTGKNPTAR
ncbi:MAG TPA: DUF1328 domain-containing protein [Gemmatimonadales bacterium]|jgi:uncharacterized membrane protein YtjA (UPF0391 family)|nr:DUF1328 domain-containing protein [Gemmatimonadales bacterium]